MGFIKDLKLGLKSYVNAIKFIKTHRLWFYFIFPILIFILVYYIGFTFEDLRHHYSADEKDSFIKKTWLLFVSGFFMLLSYVIFNFMRYILIIMMSPVLSVVSERVERIITGNKYKFNLKQLIKDIKRTINLAIRNIFWEFGLVYGGAVAIYIICFLFSIPDGIKQFIYGQYAMVIAFYYYGFGFIDYMNERQRLTIRESVKFVKKHRGFAIGLGLVFTTLFHYTNSYFTAIKDSVSSTTFLFIIIASSIIMAIIPIITMVAATLGVHEIVDLRKNPHALRNENMESEK